VTTTHGPTGSAVPTATDLSIAASSPVIVPYNNGTPTQVLTDLPIRDGVTTITDTTSSDGPLTVSFNSPAAVVLYYQQCEPFDVQCYFIKNSVRKQEGCSM
jgi:hypothetical protein